MSEDILNPEARKLVDDFALEWAKSPAIAVKGQDRNRLARKKLKPLSPRRAREFRDRFLKRHFGDRKARAERFAWLEYTYGPGAEARMRAELAGYGTSTMPPKLAPVDYAKLETAWATLESTPE